MALAGLNVGRVFAELGLDFTGDREADRYERRMDKAERLARKPITAKLRADHDERAFKAHSRAIDKADSDSKRFGKSAGIARGAIGGLGGVAASVAGGGIALLAKSFVETATSIAESTTKNEVLFGRNAKSVDRFARSSAASMGISRKAALEAAGTFGNLFSALEIPPAKSAKLSTDLTKLAGDLASFNNASPEEALDAIRSGLVGETEPLRRFGVSINDAALRTEALRQGLVKTTKEALTPQQKALAVNGLLFRQTEKAQGDFARTSGGLANQQRILRARLTDVGGELGTKLMPAVLGVVGGLNRFITSAQKGQGAAGKFAKVLGEVPALAKDISGAYRSLSNGLAGIADRVLGVVSGIIGGLASFVNAASKIPGVGSKFRGLGADLKRAQDDVDNFRSRLRDPDAYSDAGRNIERLQKRHYNSLKAIRGDTDSAIASIKKTMKTGSKEARDATAKAFESARKAVQKAMDAKVISVREGTREMDRLTRAALKLYGITGKEASRHIAGRDASNKTIGAGNEGGADINYKARGGMVGRLGERGRDAVHAVLGKGEAVLNHYQQKIVNSALMRSGIRGLPAVFGMTKGRKHYMAEGGFAEPRGYAAGGLVGVAGTQVHQSIAADVKRLVDLYKIRISGYSVRTGASRPGYAGASSAHNWGGAIDITPGASGSWEMVDKLAKWAEPSQGNPRSPFTWVGYDGDPNHGRGNHLHLQWPKGYGGGLGGLGGVEGVMAAVKIPKPVVRGGGIVGQLAQGQLERVRQAAEAFVASKAPDVGTTGGVGTMAGAGAPSGGTPAAPAQARGWLLEGMENAGVSGPAWLSMLTRQASRESGFNPRAINNWDSNAKAGIPSKGFLQTIDSTFQAHRDPDLPNDVYDPVANITAAINYMVSRYGGGNRERALSTMLARGGGGYEEGGFAGEPGSPENPIYAADGYGGSSDGGDYSGGGDSAPSRGGGDRGSGSVRGNRGRARAVAGLEALIGRLGKSYDLKAREFDLSEETFVIEGDENTPPSIDQKAVDKRTSELKALQAIRVKIRDAYARMERRIAAIVKTYRAANERIQRTLSEARGSLRGLRGKKGKQVAGQRAGLERRIGSYENKLTDYRGRIQEWVGKGEEAGFEQQGASLDVRDLTKEIKGIDPRALLADAMEGYSPPEIGGLDAVDSDDGAAGGGGGESADSGPAAEPETRPPSALEIATSASENFQRLMGDTQQLFSAFAPNFQRAGGPSGSLSPGAQALGARAFGAFGDGDAGGSRLDRSRGDIVINQTFTAPEPNANQWLQETRFMVEQVG